MPLPKTKVLLESTRGLIRDLAWGDLQLKLRSLDNAGSLPTILCIRAMRGHIQWHATANETQWLFFIPLLSNDWTVAEFHVHLLLEPDVSIALTEEMSDVATFVPPPFILTNKPEFTTIPLSDGRNMMLRVNGKMAEIYLDDEWLQVKGSPSRKNKIAYAELLRVVFAWARDKRESAPYPYNQLVPPAGDAANFLYDTVLSIRKFARPLRQWAANPENGDGGIPDPVWLESLERLQAIHPDLSGGYRLDVCNVTMRVWLDEKGEIASTRNQSVKLDLMAELLKRPGVEEVRITALPPDVVSEGPLHQAFLACLRNEDPQYGDTIDELPKQINGAKLESGTRVLIVDVEKFKRFIQSSDQEMSAVFVRIGRTTRGYPKPDFDANLMFLEGTVGDVPTWVIFKLNVEIDGNGEVHSKLSDAQFMLCRYGDTIFRAVDNFDWRQVTSYVSAIVRTLVSWHSITQQGRQP